jgi:acyl-CoA dehydrogenase
VPPSDRLGRRVAAAITAPGAARAMMLEWCYLTPSANHPVGRLHALLADVVAAEPVERKLQKALKTGLVKAHEYAAQVDAAVRAGAITASEGALLKHVREAGAEFINVDDFDPADLRAGAAARAAPASDGVVRVA